MTERERLIEILSVPIHPRIDTDPAGVVADYLLDNGVILPLVKVGDIVFCSCDNEVSEQKVTCISCDISGTWMIFTECSIHGYGDIRHCEVKDFCGNGYCNYSFSMDSIGKTVFLAREEAEAAVKEREKNGTS